MKRSSRFMMVLAAALLMVSGSAYAATDIWFGASAEDSTEISNIVVGAGEAVNLYIYSSSTSELLVASHDIAYTNPFTFGSWTTNPGYLTHIGGSGQVYLNGEMTLADGVTNGYVFETMPIWVNGYNMLVGTLTLNQNIAAGESADVSIWTDFTSGMKSSFIMSAENYSNDFVSKSLTVTVAPVPEPTGLMALGTGLIGLAGFAIRRRK